MAASAGPEGYQALPSADYGLTHADRAESQGGGSDLETGLAADSSGAAAGATLSAAATPASLAALDNLASTLDKQAATMFFGSITVSATCVGRLSAAALAVATAAAAIHILLRCTLGSRREPKLPRNFLSIAGWVNMLLVFAVMYTAPPKDKVVPVVCFFHVTVCWAMLSFSEHLARSAHRAQLEAPQQPGERAGALAAARVQQDRRAVSGEAAGRPPPCSTQRDEASRRQTGRRLDAAEP